MKKTLMLIALLSSAVVAGSIFDGMDPGAERPKSPDALAAITKLEAAEKKAKQDYDRILKAAREEAIKSLDAAKADVMKNGTSRALEEANAIQSAIDELQKVNAPKASLRDQLSDTRWSWPDKKLGDKAWFRLNADGTVTCGWHNNPAIWTIKEGRTILGKIGASNAIHTLHFNPQLTAAAIEGQNESARRLDK